MQMDAVIGCDAIDAGPDWLRLTTTSGAVRTIPWSAVLFAGFVAPSQSIRIEGHGQELERYETTHDSLWIGYGEGIVRVLIEKANRQSAAEKFAQQLGDRWRGDKLQGRELYKAMMPGLGVNARAVPKRLIMMIVALLLSILAFVLTAYLTSTHNR